jgi:hypothetical protein
MAGVVATKVTFVLFQNLFAEALSSLFLEFFTCPRKSCLSTAIFLDVNIIPTIHSLAIRIHYTVTQVEALSPLLRFAKQNGGGPNQ